MVGRLTSTAAQQMTPSGQVDNRIFAYGGVPQALDQTIRAVWLLRVTLAGLTVNRERLASRAGQSFSGATDLAEVMMLEAGLDPKTTHRIVGLAIRTALQTDQPLDSHLLDQAALEILGQPLHLSPAQITAALDPEAIVNTRTGPGGAAPDSVRTMIATFRETLTEAERWHAAMENRLARATTRLVTRAQELAGPE